MPALSSSPMHPVLFRVAAAVGVKDRSGKSLVAALAAVPDPRHRRGVRHRVTVIVALAACAVLAGCRSLVAIGEWVANAPEQVLAGIGAERVPSESTIRRVLQRLDGDALDAAIGRWALARTSPPERTRRAVAVDGKTVRGSGAGDQGARHLLAAVDHRSGVVLGQVDVETKTNEITRFSSLCDRLGDLTGVVVTADALHAQRSHAEDLHGRGAHYLLTVKGNQPSLHHQLRSLPWNDIAIAHRSTGRGHGRVERRSTKIVTLAGGIMFPHARQAIQLTRKTRRLGDKAWRTETVYAVTNLAFADATAAQIAGWIRSHWAIENQLHWVRDVTYDEDRSQVRTGSGPRTMASLRNLAISAIRLTGATNIAQASRHHAWNPHHPAELLLTT